MGLSIEIYIHGVPHGNKIWGEGKGKAYLGKYYNAKYTTKEQMFVEVANVGGEKLCYYSFVLGTDVFANDGRAGAYFAISVCINAYYADIKNMYSILNASYRKICLGKVVQTQGTGLKFCIDDFSEVESVLEGLKKNIINYISNFSNDEDIVGLTSFPIAQGGSPNLNSHECVIEECGALMKKYGILTVSDFFPTKEFSALIAKKDEELKKLSYRYTEQISSMERQHKETISSIESKANERNNSLQQQLNNKEQELESCRKDCLSLKKDLDAKNKKIQDLQRHHNSNGTCRTNEKDDISPEIHKLKEKTSLQLWITFCLAFFFLFSICYEIYLYRLEPSVNYYEKLQEGLNQNMAKVDSLEGKISFLFESEYNNKIESLKQNVSLHLDGKQNYISDTSLVSIKGLSQSELKKVKWTIDSTQYADFVSTDSVSPYRCIRAKKDGNIIVSVSFDGNILSSCNFKVKTETLKKNK